MPYEICKNFMKLIAGENNALDIIYETEELAGEVSSVYKGIKYIADLPTRMYMRKYKKLCEGIRNHISQDEGKMWIKRIGTKKAKHEAYILLEIVGAIEEDEKIPLLHKVFLNLVKGHISIEEYRRMVVYLNRTLYYDLKYMTENITKETVPLSEKLYGLVCNGWLIRVKTANQKIHKSSEEWFKYSNMALRFCDIVNGTHLIL